LVKILSRSSAPQDTVLPIDKLLATLQHSCNRWRALATVETEKGVINFYQHRALNRLVLFGFNEAPANQGLGCTMSLLSSVNQTSERSGTIGGIINVPNPSNTANMA